MSQHVLRHSGARTTTVKCPQCGDVIVYNGNFFCNGFDAIEFDKEARDIVLVPGTCTWALPHPVTSPKDRNVAEELYYSGAASAIDYN